MDFKQGFDRFQLHMLDFNAMVSADSLARIVDLFVDILPLDELGFQELKKKLNIKRIIFFYKL